MRRERKEKMNKGYIASSVTVLIWGLTFISTKILLGTFTPVEILFIRFAVGTLVLFAAVPRAFHTKGWDEEKWFMLAGLTGIFLYYFLENASMLWTSASNAGVIVSTAPFFTALLSRERKNRWFFIGFAAAMTGIAMMSLSGLTLSLSSLAGDLLALGAAFVWALYAVVTKKISTFGYSSLLTARRSFLYGLLFITVPLIFWNGYGEKREILTLTNTVNLLFLGAFASALCFVLWSAAVRLLGAVRTSVFIYLVPAVTVLASALILGEEITLMSGAGTLITLLGLVLSGRRDGKAR